MQRQTLSLLRNCVAGSGAAQLELSLQRALASWTSSGASASSLPTPAARPSLLSSLNNSGPCSPPGVRFASDLKPEVEGNTVDNWAEMRATFNKERASSLGGSYYTNVLVMGFAYWLNDSYYFPSRTLYIGALVFFALYVRKATFASAIESKPDY
ncbi:hypothetical protein HYH03_000156 [Edaphochlamys debaryana]|uniref:Uncharacterized protein n=1 Tax=Edaphochlamys debaryana TaxID=47281 RepID=A0A835YH10_9CHLO|nr:hypothetical protein HYH03_000156 [Edaphochlamys debaryana]|eukprot:KAG2501652.1 hypothetical protein HYH03_000156 [Edaphochlamys debaryana]